MDRVAALAIVGILCSFRAGAKPVTFTHDIAPILYKHCTSCHRPGEVAPFPLLTFEDAAKRAKLLATVTASRQMPPWKPEPGYGDFAGARGLSRVEIAAIQQWRRAGAPRGNPADLPPLPTLGDPSTTPASDLTVRMPRPFLAPADGPDSYRCFVIPLGLSTNRFIQGIAFQPGNAKAVHHALFFLDRSGAARDKESEPGAGYPCFGAPGILSVVGLGGWSPGAGPIQMPAGLSVPVRKGSDLILQMHFHPTGKPEMVQATAGFSFTDKPPQKRLMDIPLGSRNIDIPAGEKAYKVTDGFTVPVDVEAIGIIPHAHYLCKEMKGVAVLPDGTRRWLLWIRDWDFNWQEQYRYREPIALPEGTRLEMEFTYDNSATNPRNPNHPPKRVRWGPDSTDEMAGLHVQVVPARAGNASELAQAIWGRFMREVGGGFFREK